MKEFLIFIAAVLAPVLLILVLYHFARKKEGKEKVSSQKTVEDIKVFTDILDRNVYEVYIAGITHHCTTNDIGCFAGIVFNESTNTIDHRAMAIRDRSDGKIIGYIPSAILPDFLQWCLKEDCACVGYIFYDGETLRGRARVYHPDENIENANKDADIYIESVSTHFGWEKLRP